MFNLLSSLYLYKKRSFIWRLTVESASVHLLLSLSLLLWNNNSFFFSFKLCLVGRGEGKVIAKATMPESNLKLFSLILFYFFIFCISSTCSNDIILITLIWIHFFFFQFWFNLKSFVNVHLDRHMINKINPQILFEIFVFIYIHLKFWNEFLPLHRMWNRWAEYNFQASLLYSLSHYCP